MSLPKQFVDLSRFVEKWDLPDYNTRYDMRLSCSMEELKDFFSAVLSVTDEVKTYLDARSFADYSDEDKRLARLMFAFGVVGPAVEMFRSQRVPDSGATSFAMTIDTDLS